jgi:hypothetical protein
VSHQGIVTRFITCLNKLLRNVGHHNVSRKLTFQPRKNVEQFGLTRGIETCHIDNLHGSVELSTITSGDQQTQFGPFFVLCSSEKIVRAQLHP